jgi:hypothetical protein
LHRGQKEVDYMCVIISSYETNYHIQHNTYNLRYILKVYVIDGFYYCIVDNKQDETPQDYSFNYKYNFSLYILLIHEKD